MLASAPVVQSVNEKHTHTHTHVQCKDQYCKKHHLIPPPPCPHMGSKTAKSQTVINKYALICTQLHSHPPIPSGQGPMGVCTEIGHLSHMMSRGRGCIIDEPKQHVSVSTHHTVRRRRKQQGVVEDSLGRGYLEVGKSDENHRWPRLSRKIKRWLWTS